MIGFAARPGTDVEPACSSPRARSPSARADLLGFALVEPGPGRVVVDELDRLAVHLDLADARGLELGLPLRRHRGQVARTGVKSRDQSL